MTNKSFILLLSALIASACGSDDDAPQCQPGTPCEMSNSQVEAGAPLGDAGALPSTNDASTSTPTPAPGSTGGGSGNPPGPDSGASPGANDAGSQPPPDAGGGDASTPPGGDSGAPPTSGGAAKPSAGCGMAAPMAGMNTIDIMGTARQYILALPNNYDPKKPYRLIFAWHGLGGSAQQVASGGYYRQRTLSQDSAILVAGQGLPTMALGTTAPGWANANGQDVAFVKALYARLQSTLCIDENRVFSTGMSYGGIMSNTLGCAMGDVFRAIAPMAGSGPGFGGRATCVGQVAVWSSHGDNDTVVSTAAGEMSRDFWVRANRCQMTSKPAEPSPCVAYDGCDPEHPVTFCKFAGGHTIPPFAYEAIWKFFSQF